MTAKTLSTLASPYRDPNPGRISSSSGWLAWWRSDSWKLLALPLVLFIALPLMALFLHASLTDLSADLNSVQVAQAISLSLISSLSTTAITLILGTPVAFNLTQRRSRFYQIVDTLIDRPRRRMRQLAGRLFDLWFCRWPGLLY
jgi:ABC-type Fe3+ transport system permease subunit